MIIVFLCDISFLAQFISMSTLFGYCLIMSIVIYKKMARKKLCSFMQIILFLLSLSLGVMHSMQIFPDIVIQGVGIGCIINILAMILESFRYPDLAQL